MHPGNNSSVRIVEWQGQQCLQKTPHSGAQEAHREWVLLNEAAPSGVYPQPLKMCRESNSLIMEYIAGNVYSAVEEDYRSPAGKHAFSLSMAEALVKCRQAHLHSYRNADHVELGIPSTIERIQEVSDRIKNWVSAFPADGPDAIIQSAETLERSLQSLPEDPKGWYNEDWNGGNLIIQPDHTVRFVDVGQWFPGDFNWQLGAVIETLCATDRVSLSVIMENPAIANAMPTLRELLPYCLFNLWVRLMPDTPAELTLNRKGVVLKRLDALPQILEANKGAQADAFGAGLRKRR